MEKPNLPNKIQKTLDNFVMGIRGVYGGDLISIVLYGSAASGEYAGKHSNINLAVVLKSTSIPAIKKCIGFISKHKFLNINTVFFTEDYTRKSLDVFPIEFLDIKENHVVLYGKDVFKDISIDLKNLRFQCEHELKSKILNIKKLYLRNRNKVVLKNILFKSVTSSLHILRNFVRLKGKEPSYRKWDILDEISRELSADVSCLRKLLEAKASNIRLSYKEIDELFTCLIEVLENVSDKVDNL